MQEYFDANVTSFYVSPEGPTRNPDEDLLTMPLWDKGEIRQVENKRIAEVPVMAPITIMSPVSLHNDSVVVTYYTFMNTAYNLIAEKTADDGFLFTIARITGDPGYLIEREKQKLEGLTVTDKEQFCGSIRYFTLKGEFLYGEIFKDGKKTANITKHKRILPGTAEADSILLAYKLRVQREDSLIHFKTRATEIYCYEIPHWVGELVCTGVYINETYMEHCEFSETIGHWEYEEVCEEYEYPDPPTEPDPGSDPNPGEGGGGGIPTDPPKEEDKPQSKEPKELMDKTKFVPWNNGNCYELCTQILANYGINDPGSPEHVYQLLYEDGDEGDLKFASANPEIDYEQAIECIDRHLNNNKPIIAGVNYDIGFTNSDGTDHFIVITGRGYDSQLKLYYYTFMDCGTQYTDKGCNTEINRLYYNDYIPSLEGRSLGTYDGKRILYVTHVRPNDGNTKDTTKQHNY